MITRWDPFSEMNRLQDQLFGRRAVEPPEFRPAVDIHEDDAGFTLHVEVPGMKAEDFDVDVEKNVLTIRGERKLAKEGDEEGYRRVERFYGSFSRSFSLPETVDADAIEAKLADGVRELRVPKREAPAAKKIAIQS